MLLQKTENTSGALPLLLPPEKTANRALSSEDRLQLRWQEMPYIGELGRHPRRRDAGRADGAPRLRPHGR